MRTLIVGIGAIGGVVAARMLAAGAQVSLATRSAESARTLTATGLRVSGVGGDVAVTADQVGALDDYRGRDRFELIVIATKAAEALEIAPSLHAILAPSGILLPLQNGGVSQVLAERIGACVMGGLSNLGATMTSAGCYEQRNAGHLLIGELHGETHRRAERVRQWLGKGIDTRVAVNMKGAIWSKLLVNCSVTTIGALAGRTMREYICTGAGLELFNRVYDEALRVALATGVRLAPMIVEPIPPDWTGRTVATTAHNAWLDALVGAYGDLKPSMLQDFERGRATEIDFINGYVASVGSACKVLTPVNDAIVATVRSISAGVIAPSLSHVAGILARLPRHDIVNQGSESHHQCGRE